MFMTRASRQRPRGGFRRKLAAAVSSMIAVLVWSGLGCSVGAEERAPAPPYDHQVLSEMAQEVLRRGTTGPARSAPELTSPGAQGEPELTVLETPLDVAPPADLAPVREGISVPISPGSVPKKKIPAPAAAGYHSNSGRQRPDNGRGLSFTSGVLAPAVGLDPALAAHAHGLLAEGRPFVYGFVLLRAPVTEALEKKLAGLGVQLLGPHDDHHKARLPVGSLQAIAALPEVE